MTDVSKNKVKLIRYIDDRLSTGVEIDLNKLYIDVIRKFGVGRQSVDNYLELLWNDGQVVIDNATHIVKFRKQRIDDILAMQIGDLGKPVEADEDGDCDGA